MFRLPAELRQVLAILFQLGGALSIVGGLVGDRWQRSDPGGRAKVASIGILAGVPLYVLLFFAPLRLNPPSDGSALSVVLGGISRLKRRSACPSSMASCARVKSGSVMLPKFV